MAYKDLREWIKTLEYEGDLVRVKEEVDWNLEVGGILQENCERYGPALLFENIKDHKDTICRKLLVGSITTYPRIALMMGVDKDTPYLELIKIWKKRQKKPIKPVITDTGPCKENILKGDEVDLFQFPTPKWHDLDGGRYIGTFDGVVTRDPETDWTNVGLYRQMIHDKNSTSMSLAQGQHIWLHWRKYRKSGENMPLAVAIGWEQSLPFVASAEIPMGVDEYDIMGGLRQEPVELVKCETVDLYVPASCEIVLEGEVLTDVKTFKPCGPFAEYTGYFGGANPRPVFKVNCITYRNDPIFQGTMEGVPIFEDHRMYAVQSSALVWNMLEERMPGVTGVNVDPSTGCTNVIVQIDNSYYGQVYQVAENIWGAKMSVLIGKNVIVCDTDINIYDLNKVFWAFAYRVDPPKDIHQFPGWIHALDPIPPGDQRLGPGGNKGTRLLIDATKSIDRPRSDKFFGDKFAKVVDVDKDTIDMVRRKWDRYGIQ